MSAFRTVEISTPAYESANLRFITVKTNNLCGRGDICVFVPPHIEPGTVLPIVILLHGVYGSAWSWTLSAGVHQTVLQMMEEKLIPPMILAMPSDGLWGDGSAYLPHNGYDFEKWIVEDVPAVLIEQLGCCTNNSPLFIGGLSMGGFGALRMGLKNGNRFTAVSGLSSITSLAQMELFVEEDLENYRQTDVADEDVFQTILINKNTLPPFRFDCGTDDLLISYNRALHQQLDEAGIEHTYTENPGAHEWPYWAEHIKATLLFFAGYL